MHTTARHGYGPPCPGSLFGATARTSRRPSRHLALSVAPLPLALSTLPSPIGSLPPHCTSRSKTFSPGPKIGTEFFPAFLPPPPPPSLQNLPRLLEITWAYCCTSLSLSLATDGEAERKLRRLENKPPPLSPAPSTTLIPPCGKVLHKTYGIFGRKKAMFADY